MKRKVGLRMSVLAALAVAVAGGCSKSAATNDAAEAAPIPVEVATASLGTIADEIAAQGTFVVSQGSSAKVAPMTSGRLVGVFVKEGDTVAAGQLVATVDTRVQQSQFVSAEAAVRAAQASSAQAALDASSSAKDLVANVRAAQLGLDVANAEYATTVKQASLDEQAASTNLQKLKTGNRPEEIVQADEAARQAGQTRDQAKRDMDRNASLADKGYISGRDYEASKTAYNVAESALAAAKAQALLLHEGTRQEDLHTAELQLSTAQEALRSSKQIGQQKIDQAKTSLQLARQQELQVQVKRQGAKSAELIVQQRVADAAAASNSVATGEVRSPIAGRVAHRFMNPGDLFDAQQTLAVMEIASTASTIDFVANVTPEQAFKVRVGQSVAMTGAMADGKPIHGTVISVGQVDPQSGLVPARVHVADPPKLLRAGLSATCRISTSVHTGVVVVDRKAILDRDGKSIAFVVEGGMANQTAVELGARQGDLVEVSKGLKAGQTVVKLGQFEIDDKTKVEPIVPDKADADDATAKS